MTEKVYLVDSYAKELEATVTRAESNQLVLDRTIFYPAGGGQPDDTGMITVNGAEYRVTGLKKEGDDVVHILDRNVDAKPGDAARCAIDWNRRYACMRLHTALHTLDGVIEVYYGSGMITGGQIYPERARIDIDMPDLSREKVQEILDKTNAVAKEGHRINCREISVEEAAKATRLARTEPGRKLLETLKRVRVVEIEGVDTQADGGTHVANTSELGTITLSNYENKGTRRKRIEIMLK